MALRTQTVTYAFPTSVASLAAATRRDFAGITLFIPEVTSRTFRSVAVRITARQADATAVSLTSWLIGIKLGAVAFSDVTITDTFPNTGEHQTWAFIRNVTSYFTTNFGAGTSQTCQVGVQFGGVVTINITAEVIITYEYDDAAQTTRVKTVWIPLESPVGNQPNTLTQIGTNQVPLLDTFLPEASKVFRNIYFKVCANEAADAITDFQMGLSLDAEAETLDGLHEQALISAVFYEYLWERNDLATNAVHAFNARATAVATGTVLNTLSVILVVTYEYDHDTSTTILNSLLVPLGPPEIMGFTTAADQTRLQCKFLIEEPAPITLAQSGVLLAIASGASANFSVAAGAQIARTYTHDAGTTTCGMFATIQRIDSGGAQGAGISLARGENTLTLDVFGASTTIGHALSAVAILNYTSGKASGGAGVHNHTTQWLVATHLADAQLVEVAAVAPNIPESAYWVTALGLLLDGICNQGESNSPVEIKAKILAEESLAAGWVAVLRQFSGTDPENQIIQTWADVSRQFARHPSDPDSTRLAVESARKYRFAGRAAWSFGLVMYLTYHAIPVSVTRAVTGYTGDGSGIAVEIRRTDTDEKLYAVTTVAGGNYTFTAYDDTIPLTADARQDATHVGRSEDFTAS